MSFIFAYVWDNRVIKVGRSDFGGIRFQGVDRNCFRDFRESWLRISSLVYLEKIERKASSA